MGTVHQFKTRQQREKEKQDEMYKDYLRGFGIDPETLEQQDESFVYKHRNIISLACGLVASTTVAVAAYFGLTYLANRNR